MFTKYLIYTNVMISVTFSGLGDLIEQVYEITVGHQKDWDKMRTVKLASTGFPVGLACHNWYIVLDRCLSVRNGKNLAKKIVLDQLIASPVYICLFFTTLGLWNDWSKVDVIENIKKNGKEVYKMEWYVWPIAQLFNFYFLPTKFRILYDCTISLGFDVYFSYVTNKDTKPK
jgi:protein Mpv17